MASSAVEAAVPCPDAALGVPQQTLAALERLQHLVMQPTITAGDMRVIRTLAQEIQEQVSN